MKKDVAIQWAAALRSGKFKQGRRYLHRGDNYCCLGVLSEMAVDAGVRIEVQVMEDDIVMFDENTCVMSDSVRAWSELNSTFGSYGQESSLASDNDDGKTFAEIADHIEQNWENL